MKGSQPPLRFRCQKIVKPRRKNITAKEKLLEKIVIRLFNKTRPRKCQGFKKTIEAALPGCTSKLNAGFMKKFIILMTLVLTSCATIDTNSIDSLLKHKGSGLKSTFSAPSDTVFKVAKSLALHGPCAKGTDIVYDEITGHIYSTSLGPYGMRTILWLLVIEPIAENNSQVEFIWSTQVWYSQGMNYDLKGTVYNDSQRLCSGKVIFKGIEEYVGKK